MAVEIASSGGLQAELFLQTLDREGVILGPGPTGTELPAGSDAGDYPALGKHNIALTDPGVLVNVHAGYLEVDSSVVFVESYTWANLHDERRDVDRSVLVDVTRAERQAALDAADLEYRRTGAPRYVVDTVRPVGDCYHPTPDSVTDDKLLELHLEQAAIFADAGSEAVLLQTFPSIREIKKALEAYKEKKIRVVGISVYAELGEDGIVRLPGGESLAEVAKIAQENGALVGVNCVTPEAGARGVEQIIAETEGDLRLYVGLNGLPKDPHHRDYLQSDGRPKPDKELGEIARQASSRQVLEGAYRRIVEAVREARRTRRVAAVLASCCFTGPDTTARIVQIVHESERPADELVGASTDSDLT